MNLRELQLQELEILLEFRRICKKHGLPYFLTAGTLLGAVRHGGFIPWDDDIDVAMPRDAYEKFACLCQTELSEEYFFQDYNTENNFPYLFAKIRKHGTHVYEPSLGDVDMHSGIYIDIFPLDICPDQPWRAVLFFKGVELLNCAVLSRVSTSFVCGYQKPYMRLLFSALRKLPNRALFKLREWLCKGMAAGASKKTLCTVGGHHGYPKETYRAEWFDATTELAFEGHGFSIPNGWDALLRNMYGDYMNPPPVTERTGHFE